MPEGYSQIPIKDFVRGPSRAELGIWERLIKQHRKASDAIDRCSLLFQCAIIAQRFADANTIDIRVIPAELEQEYLAVLAEFTKLTNAIRGVEDHTLGVNFRDGDVDILSTQNEVSGLGAIPLIILGVVVVAGCIAVAYWATKNALEISQQAARAIKKADSAFCADPDSELCQRWNEEKLSSGYTRNESLAETIKSGVESVGKSLVFGAIALVAISFLWRRK